MVTARAPMEVGNGPLPETGASTGLVGRANEHAQIEAALDQVPAGGAPIVWLQGEPGIGKTALWAEGVDAARRRDFTVLIARPAASESELAFAGLVALFESVPDDLLDELPGLQRDALNAALLRTDQALPTAPGLHAVAAGVVGVLRLLADSAPVVVAIDDIQWLDRPTGHLVQYAMRRTAGLNVGFLIACREDAGTPTTEMGGHLITGRFQLVPVGPLSVGTLHHVLVQRANRTLRRPDLVHLHELCGGNPLYAIEIALTIPADGRLVVDRLPKSLDALLSTRIEALSPAALQVVRISTLLARPTAQLVTEAVGNGDAVAALVEAERANVLVEQGGVLRFTHPLLATAALQGVGPVELRSLHSTLAGVVTDAEEAARHRARAAQGPDAAASAALESAVYVAARRGATAAAAELAEMAAELTPDDDVSGRAQRLHSAGWYHLLSGDQARAVEPLEEVIRLSPNQTVAAMAEATLGGVFALRGRVSEAGPHFERGIAGLSDIPALQCATRVVAAWVTVFHDIESASAQAQQVVADARALGEEGIAAAAAALVAAADLLRGRGADLDEVRQLATVPTHPVLPISCEAGWFAAVMLFTCDRLDEARELLAARRERALAAGEVPAMRAIYHALLEVELRSGDLNAALATVEAAEETVFLAAEDHLIAVDIFTARAQIAALRGDLEVARDHCRHAAKLSVDGEHRLERILVHWVMGFVALSGGDVEGAVGELLAARELARVLGLVDPGMVTFHGDLIEALVVAGRLEDAAEVSSELEEYGLKFDRGRALAVGARGRGLVAAASGDLDGALVALDEALMHHAGLPVPFERGRTLLALGSVRRRAKQKRAAREALEAALVTFSEMGAEVWAERARAELRRVGGRAPSTSTELSETEQSVAELVAAGLTNDEVAARLFISRRTVEANLTRIYRKLEIRSRTELAALLS